MRKRSFVLGRVIGIFTVMSLQASWAWSQEVCDKGPAKAKKACQISDVESVFDSVENRAPRNYQAVIDQLKICSAAIGQCFKSCKNTSVNPSDSLSSLVKTLQSSLGKPPTTRPVYQCREILKTFSSGLENSCDLRRLKVKLVQEKSAKNIRPLLSICQAMGKMETVAFKGDASEKRTAKAADASAAGAAVTSESVPEANGNFEPIVTVDFEDSEKVDPADEGTFETVVSEDERASPSESGVQASRIKGRAGYSPSRGGGMPEYRPEKPSVSPFGGRSSKRRQKIPSHGLSPQERMARDMEMYGSLGPSQTPKARLKTKTAPKTSPVRLRSVNLPLKKAPEEQSIWEIHHKAFKNF